MPRKGTPETAGLNEGERTCTVQLDPERTTRVANLVIETLNEALASGISVDEVLGGCAGALGFALAQRGVMLDLSARLDEALPPLVHGYRSGLADRLQA